MATDSTHEVFRTRRFRESERRLWSQYGLAPTERFVDVETPPLRIRVVEVGSGRPVLFAHGTAGNGPGFAPLIHELRGLRCVLFDRPGFALSAPTHFDVGSFGTVVAALQGAVLDALGIPTLDVVGHSIGGLFALRFALHHPQRVRRLVLLGGGPMVDAAVPPIIRLIASPAGAVFVRLVGNGTATRAMLRGNGHRSSLASGRIPPAWVDWRTSVSRDTPSMHHERAMVRAIVAKGRYRRGLTLTEPELRSLRQPTLMLLGSNDPVGSVALWTRVMETVPNGRLSVVAGAGHMVWLDEPDRVARELMGFLAA